MDNNLIRFLTMHYFVAKTKLIAFIQRRTIVLPELKCIDFFLRKLWRGNYSYVKYYMKVTSSMKLCLSLRVVKQFFPASSPNQNQNSSLYYPALLRRYFATFQLVNAARITT